MRKIYAASWKLFTLTAEADRVLSQLVMFLTVFFHWMYKMKYSCYQESSLTHGWFVYWVFGWEMRRLSKPIIRFRMASFLFYILLDAYENHKGSSDPCLTSIAFRSCISWNMVSPSNYKQLLDEVFVISGIIKVEVSVAEADNTNRDLDYSRYYKNRI